MKSAFCLFSSTCERNHAFISIEGFVAQVVTWCSQRLSRSLRSAFLGEEAGVSCLTSVSSLAASLGRMLEVFFSLRQFDSSIHSYQVFV
jgi:hypothetical protein